MLSSHRSSCARAYTSFSVLHSSLSVSHPAITPATDVDISDIWINAFTARVGAPSSSTQSVKNKYVSIGSLTKLLSCPVNHFDPVVRTGNTQDVFDLTHSPHLGDLCITCKTKFFGDMLIVVKTRKALEEFGCQIVVPGKDNALLWKESIRAPG
ncbi:uncharacterized protein EV420DRAFT_1168178 [Desarmillaria tabescens]|uniref:Uncharacterized protein n=1 Tax=Armillaria tabescens TaxID=1929756 RepID=A0AA39MM82_ARMTA|nr:uncharacterized protein EV420DRAFT_1168178 [Desarmillaria tabescens]KAK0439966.1 hypothetical protein EV420DRAFT_1168178 [Desarmillaria tabescens]